MASEQTRTFLEGVFARWRESGDRQVWIDALAPTLRWTVTGSSETAGVYEGRQAYVDNVLAQVDDWLSESQPPKLNRLIVEGDSAAALLTAAVRTTDGQNLTMTYCWLITVTDSRITDVVGFYTPESSRAQ